MRAHFFLFCLMLLVTASPLYAASPEPKSFAVLPFSVHGPEKYRYLSQGIQSMLISRLSWEDRFVSAENAKLRATSGDVDSEKKAHQILSGLDVDYLVWGSVTIMEKQSSVDLKLLKGEGNIVQKNVQTPLSDLIPSLEKVAKQINSQVFNRKTEIDEQEQRKKVVKTEKRALNPGFIYNEGGGEPGAGQLNPQIKYSHSSGAGGRWRSQTLPFVGRRMLVEDVDADGVSEIFIMEKHKLHAYSFKQNKLAHLATFDNSGYFQMLNLDVLDLNRDGYKELVISTMREDSQKSKPKSKILNFIDGQFKVKEDNIPYYLGVVRRPPDFRKILVGQAKGFTDQFETEVHEVLKMSGKYRLGPRLNLPEQATVFNFAYLPQKDQYKIIIASSDELQVYSASGERQFTTEETYAASGIGIEKDMSKTGFGPDNPPEYYFLPTRIVPFNLDKDERFELLVSRNMSVAADFFPSYRQFPQGEVHSLYWDGIGLSILWKTRLIKGTIVDYGIADYNNDDQPELYVCINTHPGTVGLKQVKTVMLGYDLNL